MKLFSWAVLLWAVTLAVRASASGAEPVTNASPLHFYYERYSAESGALYDSRTRSHYNELVHSVLVDSKGSVWTGTQNGLTIFDGTRWTKTTFPLKNTSVIGRALLGSVIDWGPKHIVEGPPGTIWLDVSMRVRNGRYEEISAPIEDYVLKTVVDPAGSLWVLTKPAVYRYNGSGWVKVLHPYRGGFASSASGLFGMVVETNGNVWVGGTVYGELKGPWEHEGLVWTVENRNRLERPPLAPMFMFDGKRWKAFGSQDGLRAQEHDSAVPELDGHGRVVVRQGEGYLRWNGAVWKPVAEADVTAGKRWRLRPKDSLGYFGELLFRDGEQFIPVQPTEHKSGEVWDFTSEPLAVLRLAEDRRRDCIWLGTMHGLYRIWAER